MVTRAMLLEQHASRTVELVGGRQREIESDSLSRDNAEKSTDRDCIRQGFAANPRVKHVLCILGNQLHRPQRHDSQKFPGGL
jgi:hypothetical protein